MTTIGQDALDYSNDAQMRVAVDTRALQRVGTILILQNEGEYDLGDDVVKVLAVLDGDGNALQPLSMDDALSLLSGPAESGGAEFYYALEPGVIGIYPTPDADGEATIYYQARPHPLLSSDEFELTGEAEALIERVTLASAMDDDGQPEWAAYHQGYYEAEAARLRRLRSDEQPSRFQVAQ